MSSFNLFCFQTRLKQNLRSFLIFVKPLFAVSKIFAYPNKKQALEPAQISVLARNA